MHREYKEIRATDICPICGLRAMKGQNHSASSFIYICGTCGIFRVTEEFLYSLPERESQEGKNLYKLSYQFRIASQNIRKPIDVPVHFESELPRLLSSVDPTVEGKLAKMLRLLGEAASYPGEKVDFQYSTDYPLVCSKNPTEAMFFLESLSSQGLIEFTRYTSNYSDVSVVLTTKGWLELERINKAGSESAEAFVAMWFHPDRFRVYEGISRAIRTSGYEPVRIDRVEHVNRIDDEIIARIRRSKFLIADFTGQRNGVYFEAGFMLGLGRPVIWLCEHDHLDKVHFDTRQYNTIDYTSVEDLERRLVIRIEAILGRGPNGPS